MWLVKGIQKRNAEYVIMANRKRKLDQWISDYWYERYTRYIRTDRLFWETPELHPIKIQLNGIMSEYALSNVPWPLTTSHCMNWHTVTIGRDSLSKALREWGKLNTEAQNNLVVYFVRQYKKKFYTEVTGKVMPGSAKPTEKLTCEILQEFLSKYGVTRWTLQIDGPREAIYNEGMFL